MESRESGQYNNSPPPTIEGEGHPAAPTSYGHNLPGGMGVGRPN